MSKSDKANYQAVDERGLPPGNIKLTAGEVHVWRIHLAGHENGVYDCCRQFLSPGEAQRAGRLHFEKGRRHFTIARAAMRRILGAYANIAPQKLVFSYGARGKPELSADLHGDELAFNLSHSRECALLAVAQRLCVGVDIEFVDHQFATEEIAKQFFSANEISALAALPPSERVEAFFCCWTRKEAYLKALGEGILVPLDSFEVAFGASVPAALLRVDASASEVARWKMYDIAAPRGYRAALVVEGKQHTLRHWEWKAEPETSQGVGGAFAT